MNKKLPLYLQSCHYSFKVNFRPQALALLSFFLISFSASAKGPVCPNVFAGDDVELESGELCTDLTASYLDTGETTSYAVYTSRNGNMVTETDDVTVTRTASFTLNLGGDQELCDTPSYEITAEIIDGNPADATFLWSTGETTQSITVTTSGPYTVDVTIGADTITGSVEINFNELPLFDLGANIETCFSKPVVLNASPSNYNPADLTYEWSLDGEIIVGENNSKLIIEEIGTYSVTASFAGCAASDSVEVSFRDDLVVTVNDDILTCPKEPHTLTAKTKEPDATYQWYLNGTLLTGATNSTLDIMVEQGTIGTQTYSVVISVGGCTGTDSVDVRLYNLTNCVITQGISPNGDGYNDSLELSWLNDRTGIVKLKIYNRWGTLVFDQRNYSNQWRGQSHNGNELPTGTYFYVIDLKAVDAVYGGRTTGWIYLNQKAN